jgi:hypothetical protein
LPLPERGAAYTLTWRLVKVDNVVFFFEATGGVVNNDGDVVDLDLTARFVHSKGEPGSVAEALPGELSNAANSGYTDDTTKVLAKLEKLCSDGMTQSEETYTHGYVVLTGHAPVATVRRAARAIELAVKKLGTGRHAIMLD